MPAWCNHCSEEIEYLYYRSDVVEYGRSDTDGSGCEANDSDTSNTEYSCPECEREVDPDGLYDEDPNEEEEDEEDETVEQTDNTERGAENRTTVKISFDEKVFTNRRTSGHVNVVTCSGCKHTFTITSREDAVCPKCDQDNHTNEVITI